MLLRTREERAAALEQVPEEFRSWVAKLVEMVFIKRRIKSGRSSTSYRPATETMDGEC